MKMVDMNGTQHGRLLPPEWTGDIACARMIDGKLCGVQRFIFTSGFLVGLRFDGWTYSYDRRYCYADDDEAVDAARTWDGQGDPPGRWVKEKVSGRLGPAIVDASMEHGK